MLLERVIESVQDYKEVRLGDSLGVAVRDFPLKTGFADYMLFVDRKTAGVVEAKPEGTTLSGVSEQTAKYLFGLPETIPHVADPLPFGYESTGSETFFRDLRDPESRSRRVFASNIIDMQKFAIGLHQAFSTVAVSGAQNSHLATETVLRA